VEKAEEEAEEYTGFEEEYYDFLEEGDWWWTVIPSKPGEEEAK